MHRFIVFEGIDGSGKSTLAQRTARALNAIYYQSPPEIIRPLRQHADAAGGYIRYSYYLFGNYIASAEINELLKYSDVVCDWYVYSTIVYHSVLLNTKLPIPEEILTPTVIFHIKASIEIINGRLNARPSRNQYEEQGLLEKVAQKYDELFAKFANVYQIDTSATDETAVLENILEILGKT